VNEKVKENLEVGCSGPLHELGARVGLVQPTTSEEIKFGAERMGTAGPTAKLNEMKENVQEKGAQVWTQAQENVEIAKEKVKGMTEAPGPLHEAGARVGLVQPTISEEIKFVAEKMERMGTAGPTAKLRENVDVSIDKMKGVTENLQEKSKEVWNKTQDKAHESVAQVGSVGDARRNTV